MPLPLQIPNLGTNVTTLAQPTLQMTNQQAKAMADEALKIASQQIDWMRQESGTPDGVPMKTIDREKNDMDSLRQYYESLGQVAPKNSLDPSADIRKLGEMWATSKDPAEQSRLHQMALDMATKSGWLKPGETNESVSTMPQMSMAGTPNYDAQMDMLKLKLGLGKGTGSGSGDKTTKPNKDEVTAAMKLAVRNLAMGNNYVDATGQIVQTGMDWSGDNKTASRAKMLDWIERNRPQYEAMGANVDNVIVYLDDLTNQSYSTGIRKDPNK